MRIEPYTIEDFVHVYNRGNRKQPIVRDSNDKWRFLQVLYYFNDEFSPANPLHSIEESLKLDFNSRLVWPENWPTHKPIVKIIAFGLLENHFHLLLKEITKGGISKFMQKLGTGVTNRFNTKYHEVGRLFQGSYKGRRVSKDIYFQYLSVYIQVKNIFELYPGGIQKAMEEFDKAYEWAVKYPYCSLADYAINRNSPIIDKDILGEMFPRPEDYKEFARQCLLGMNLENKLGNLIIE